jgi:hypothetical protein
VTRKLRKQEASATRVCSWRSCVLPCITYERCEEIWGERQAGTLLHRTISHYGPVAYKLDLPPSLVGVHNVVHVSQLQKCLNAPPDVVLPDVTLLEADLSYPEHPIKLLDHKDCATRRNTLKFYRAQWSNHSEEEVTWESEEFLHSHHQNFLPPMEGMLIFGSCFPFRTPSHSIISG